MINLDDMPCIQQLIWIKIFAAGNATLYTLVVAWICVLSLCHLIHALRKQICYIECLMWCRFMLPFCSITSYLLITLKQFFDLPPPTHRWNLLETAWWKRCSYGRKIQERGETIYQRTQKVCPVHIFLLVLTFPFLSQTLKLTYIIDLNKMLQKVKIVNQLILQKRWIAKSQLLVVEGPNLWRIHLQLLRPLALIPSQKKKEVTYLRKLQFY